MSSLRDLEGQRVCVALVDGTRVDDCTLVSAGRGRAQTIWIFSNGNDTFIRRADVLDLWPIFNVRRLRAA
jgi:hypothetical protein